jgi:hypothetical protein
MEHAAAHELANPARSAGSPGRKTRWREPKVAPFTSAPPMSAAASTAVRCCRIRPGFFRAARIFSITTGRPVTNDNASDERRTYPPPSPWEPSMVRIPDAIVPLL